MQVPLYIPHHTSLTLRGTSKHSSNMLWSSILALPLERGSRHVKTSIGRCCHLFPRLPK